MIDFYPFDRPFSVYSLGHILGGMITATLAYMSPITSILLFTGFTIYEWVEQEKINDAMYRDYVEFLLGMYGAAIPICLMFIL